MGVQDLDRFVFFKCNDCGRAFWKKPLLAPRDNYTQHTCLGQRTATRMFGTTARTCTQNHPNTTCVVKISQEEYSSLPNCGCWERYLTGVPLRKPKRKRPSSSLTSSSTSVRKKRSRSVKVRKIRQTKPKSKRPKDMNNAVRNILRQNRLVHKRKKKSWMREKRTSVWDPGDCADSWNEVKVPLEEESELYNPDDFDDPFNNFVVPNRLGVGNYDHLEYSVDEEDTATSEFSEGESTLPAVPRADWRLPSRFSFRHLDHDEADISDKFQFSEDDNLPQAIHLPDMSFSHCENSPRPRPWTTPTSGMSSPAALDYFKNNDETPPILVVEKHSETLDKHSETPTPSKPDDSEKHSNTQTLSIVKDCQKLSETPMPSIRDDFEELPGSTVVSGLDECESDVGSSKLVVVKVLECKGGSINLKSESKKQQSNEELFTSEEKDILTFIDRLIEKTD